MNPIALVTGAPSPGSVPPQPVCTPLRVIARPLVPGAAALARFQKATAQLSAEANRQVFTPLNLNLNALPAYSLRSPSWSSEVAASISSCPMPGWSQMKRMLTATVELFHSPQ